MRPRASVVFPDPKSPDRYRTRPGAAPGASDAPSARVAASSASSIGCSVMDYVSLAARIKGWGAELGFQAVGIADADLSAAEPRLAEWLQRGWHGEMDYMARHGVTRARPAALIPGTLRVISCRMNYSASDADERAALADRAQAYVARYARGRDYHTLVRSRLQKLCDRIEQDIGAFGHRVFADSAPVLEVELAAKAGIGWRDRKSVV